MEITGEIQFRLHLFSYNLLYKDKDFCPHLDNSGIFHPAVSISNGHLWVENSDDVDFFFFLINPRI